MMQRALLRQVKLENTAQTTQTLPVKGFNKFSVKIPNEQDEKGEVDDELDKLQNIGHMWKNDQEKFSSWVFNKILFSIPQLLAMDGSHRCPLNYN